MKQKVSLARNAASAAMCAALALFGVVGIVGAQAFAPTDTGLVQQAEAKASAGAVKWLKGKWYTNGGYGTYPFAPDKPRSMVKFTRKCVKYYKYTKKGKWVVSGKTKIAKTKKTKKGYNVYLQGGTRYVAYSKKGLYERWGKSGFSGTGSLWRK